MATIDDQWICFGPSPALAATGIYPLVIIDRKDFNMNSVDACWEHVITAGSVMFQVERAKVFEKIVGAGLSLSMAYAELTAAIPEFAKLCRMAKITEADVETMDKVLQLGFAGQAKKTDAKDRPPAAKPTFQWIEIGAQFKYEEGPIFMT